MSGVDVLWSRLSEDELKDFILSSNDFAALNGLLLRTADGAIVTIRHTLLPSPYPRIQFEEAVDIQRSFNSLFLRVASDYEFMEVLSQDEYVYNLWKIYQMDNELGPLQPLKLSLNRSDYMLHSALPGCPLKQVEMNFIASSFGGIAERLVKVHQRRLDQLLGANAPKLRGCPSATRFGSAIARAVEEYVKSSAHLQRTCLPAVLMVVSENETNIYDQRSIEEAMLCANVALRLLRRTFAELGESARRVVVEESTGRLFVYVVAWQTKLRLERSLAIKCPSIDYLLANMKLVQTALAAGSTSLSRFGVSVGTAERLAAAFARQTVLSTDFNFADPVVIEKMVDECRRGPDKFVLKPQREGGGNNVFGVGEVGMVGVDFKRGVFCIAEDIARKLDEVMGKAEANAYILMERLEPPVVENCVVGMECASPLRCQMVSELGIYGVLLRRCATAVLHRNRRDWAQSVVGIEAWERRRRKKKKKKKKKRCCHLIIDELYRLVSRGTEELENHEAGHLLRTKHLGVNEGGVVTGFANLDSPLLI
ncbi:unnamed protein product [Hydatigera taeniaeformis]|uniref:Glutathione synthetase n=1 Tax=Hydatigena taeniaeformis TaxID=6205 RepID=A0A0R3WZJ4_HYDTA|nr:unnamed protein product [Hydatigera taeniaeformis]